jgi:hypothetical protein
MDENPAENSIFCNEIGHFGIRIVDNLDAIWWMFAGLVPHKGMSHIAVSADRPRLTDKHKRKFDELTVSWPRIGPH